MKKVIVFVIISVVFISTTTIAQIQKEKLNNRSVSKMVADKGYWVVESNIKTPKSSTVHFYSIDNNLMYSEKVDGVKLNIEKKKTVVLLNRVLLQTLLARRHQQQNQQLVRNMFK